jgi:hypothetical protein
MRNDQTNGLTTGNSALRGYPCWTATNRKGVANRNVWTDRMLDALPKGVRGGKCCPTTFPSTTLGHIA